jgi:hypothetical protein
MIVPSTHEKGQSTTIGTRRVGQMLIFEQLWMDSSFRGELKALLAERNFLFDADWDGVFNGAERALGSGLRATVEEVAGRVPH